VTQNEIVAILIMLGAFGGLVLTLYIARNPRQGFLPIEPRPAITPRLIAEASPSSKSYKAGTLRPVRLRPIPYEEDELGSQSIIAVTPLYQAPGEQVPSAQPLVKYSILEKPAAPGEGQMLTARRQFSGEATPAWMDTQVVSSGM
jgi:hypothetical protein